MQMNANDGHKKVGRKVSLCILKDQLQFEMDYLGAFIVGSSFPVFAPFAIGVQFIKERNFSLTWYPIIASLWFGVMNALSLFLAKRYNLNEWKRYLLITLVSASIVAIWATTQKSYNFTSPKQWIFYYILLFLAHGFTYLFTIRRLEQAIIGDTRVATPNGLGPLFKMK